MVVCVVFWFLSASRGERTKKNIPDGVTCNFSIAYTVISIYQVFGRVLLFFLLLFLLFAARWPQENREQNQETQVKAKKPAKEREITTKQHCWSALRCEKKKKKITRNECKRT